LNLDYGGAGNSAAYMVFELASEEQIKSVQLNEVTRPPTNIQRTSNENSFSEIYEQLNQSEPKRVLNSRLMYTVYYYYINNTKNTIGFEEIDYIGDDDVTIIGAAESDIQNNSNGLRNLVIESDSSQNHIDKSHNKNNIEATCVVGSPISIFDIIMLEKSALEEAFMSIDENNEGFVSVSTWAEV
jgi:hypothetical protein